MDQATAISGVLAERNALQQPDGLSLPSYISQHMQALAQYTSALEENLANLESKFGENEANLFKSHMQSGKSVNAAQTQIKYELATEKAVIARLSRLCSSSWRFISVSQSRIKHLIAEANNQV